MTVVEWLRSLRRSQPATSSEIRRDLHALKQQHAVKVAAFNARHIGRVQLRSVCKFLLREAASVSELLHAPAECLP